MSVGDMAWLPHLPQHYYSVMTPKANSKADKDKPSKLEESGGKQKAQPVRNLNMESCFEDFKTGIANNKFNDVIKKVGLPPTVKRGSQDVQMCVSYHL